MVNVTGDLL